MWINQAGQVYAGDRQGNDKSAPVQPDNTMWDQITQSWIPIPIDPTLAIRGIFQKAIQEKPVIATPSLQKEILKLSSVVERALELGLYEAALEAIKEPPLPPELEPYRDAMMNAVMKPVDGKALDKKV